MSFADPDWSHQQQAAAIDDRKIVEHNLRFAFGYPHRLGITGIVIGERAVLVACRNARRSKKPLPLIGVLTFTTARTLAGCQLHPGAETARAGSVFSASLSLPK